MLAVPGKTYSARKFLSLFCDVAIMIGYASHTKQDLMRYFKQLF